MPRLPPKPDLDWTPEGAPIARGAGDIYFSRAGGLAETEAVFLCGCGLPACWAGRTRFTILELGFGTGLNALAAWRAWAQTRAPGAVLHFISVEHAPLEAADGARALKHFPELAPYAARLIARWPVRARGPQRLWFEEDGFALTLLIDEARAALAHRAINADAVFLDGFSPARNASMWNAELIGLVTRNAAPDARLATYSVAGAVRRALEAEGWRVEKRPGFGAKRERLEAQRGRETAGRSSISVHAAAHGRIAILGAGIAGAALAHALKRRGREALLIEAAPRRGAGASGNP
ncbi:MAG: tRNA (5-methylaminomethyl-2-thiouridine)(34)-methyltransferase MnmD, partial [Hyphomonadaceae bacterium]